MYSPALILLMGLTRPRLFFTDLESGPSTVGEGNLGAFITRYGEGFGFSRSCCDL